MQFLMERYCTKVVECMVSTLAGNAGIAGKAGKWAFFQNLAGKAVKPYGFLLLWLEKLEF